MSFAVGDLVVIKVGRSNCSKFFDGKISTITKLHSYWCNLEIEEKKPGQSFGIWLTEIKLVNKSKQGGIMNIIVAKLFEKTSDAVLVDKHLGIHIGESPINAILLEGKQEELLDEAKRIESYLNKDKN